MQYHRIIPLADRFWKKVDLKGPVPAHRPELGPCWLWTGVLTQRGGYGQVWVRGRGAVKATRVSWELHRGEIADGLLVLHHCDTPACIRPDHLFLGDALANMRDMDAKGRRVNAPMAGVHHYKALLTPDTVRRIRRLCGPENPCYTRVARELGLDPALVRRIALRLSWASVA